MKKDCVSSKDSQNASFSTEIIGKVFRLLVAVDSLEIGGYLLKSLGML